MIETKKKALKLKEWGNDAFKKKKYELAENFYSKALELNLDSRPSWTNRAICRNAMKKHGDALADCISALSIDSKCTKAGVKFDWAKLTVHYNLSHVPELISKPFQDNDSKRKCSFWLGSI